MDPTKTGLLQDDHLSTVRNGNKALIIVFFSLIICLALVIGGIIVSLVIEYNSSVQAPNPVEEFCSVAENKFKCLTFFSSSIKISQDTEPNHVFIFSLESAVDKLLNINFIMSSSDPSDLRTVSAFKNCSRLLREATGHLKRALRVNPVLVTDRFETRRDMEAWIGSAIENLMSCSSDLGKMTSVSTDLEMTGDSTGVETVVGEFTMVDEVAALVNNSKAFLRHYDLVNINFNGKLAKYQDNNSRLAFLEYLPVVTFYGLQYFILMFLFYLLVLRYR